MKKFLLRDAEGIRFTSFLKKASFGALLALASITTFALQLELKTDTLRILIDTKSPCSDKVSVLMTDEVKKMDWVGAEVTYMGHTLVACAAPAPEEVLKGGPLEGKPSLMVLDEQGDGGIIDATAFHQVKSI